MKHLLLTTIAAVLVVGCGESQPPELPTAKPPDISIREAVKTGNIEAVKQHLDAGADVNAKGKYGRTPLHYAATRGLKKIIELLIARGADVNTKIEVGDYKGQTPLDGAIQWNHTEIADLLRKHGGKTGEELKAEGK
jgi:ankyrin repeat protein